jgi:hypothetical protein
LTSGALSLPDSMWNMDGATIRLADIGRDCVNANFLGRWMESGRPIAWPPRSPELTLSDFQAV